MTASDSATGRASRRNVLRGFAASAAVAASGLPMPVSAHSLRPPGSRPFPHLPEGTDTIPQIEHIIVVMMENHSYDNRLGTLCRPGADGLRLDRHGVPVATNPYPDGRLQRAFHMPTACQLPAKPAQDWLDSHVQYADGANDGFVRSSSGPVAMGYWDRADQPFYNALASVFPLADRYFGSLLGQTYPNRRYLLAGTSFGQVGDDLPVLTTYPPNGTIYDRLDAHGVTWKTYYDLTSLPTTLLFPRLFFNNPTKHVSNTQFFTDAAAGTLPNFCIVDPQYGWQSEENPQNIAQGEEFVSRVVQALFASPLWERSLLIWTYDEHGGYYDHVPPPRAVAPDDIPPAVPDDQVFEGFTRYGFRVPCVAVSPWSRRNHVSHTVYDHTSILKVLETKWNLPAMTYRDANAHSLLDMLDLHRPAFREPPRLPAPLMDTDPGALACSATGPGTIPPPDSIIG
jgi:phospholipase C